MNNACLRTPNVHVLLTLVNRILGLARLGKAAGRGPEPLSWRDVADFRERLMSHRRPDALHILDVLRYWVLNPPSKGSPSG